VFIELSPMMRNWIGLLAIASLLCAFGSARASTDTTYTLKQEFVPYSDSGQWVVCYIDLTNNTSAPLTMYWTLIYTWPDSYWAFDTVKWHGYAYQSDSTIILPAHSATPDLRLKLFYKRAIPDTTLDQVQICAPRCSFFNFTGRGNCAPPPHWGLAGGYDSNGYNNLDHIVEPGKDYYHWYADPYALLTPTDMTIRVFGEYSDRFRVSPPHRLGTMYDSVDFLGAPVSVVHDTIEFTLTNCLGTFKQYAPINAYSHITQSHTVRISPKHDSLRVPFLDHAIQQVIIRNTSGIELAVSDLKTSDAKKFRLVSSTAFTLQPGDSSTIAIDVIDLVARDLATNYETATLTGKIHGTMDEKIVADSVLSVALSARVMVYAPPFVGAVPRLTHSERPYGLLLVVPHADYSIYYTNNDTESYDFLVPYFDNHDFRMSTLPPLPGTVPSGALIIGTTGFDGNQHANTRTQLHWPRIRVRDGIRDTVTIDVLAVGDQAALGVASAANESRSSAWPDPASATLRFESGGTPQHVEVIDLLGRVRIRTVSEGTLDISALPNGSYLLLQGEHVIHFQVQH
jgi:hypothetical protein